MIFKKALNKIRSVTIYYTAVIDLNKYYYIRGFSFFDKDGAQLWWIGDTHARYKETVVLEENERIVGVVAKLAGVSQSLYCDFQFQIASE